MGPQEHQTREVLGVAGARSRAARPSLVSVAGLRAGLGAGFTPLFRARPGGRGFIAGYGWLELDGGTSWSRVSGSFELALLVVRGACHVTVGGAPCTLDEVLGPRLSPFDEGPYAIVVPGSTRVRVTAVGGLEAVLCWVPAAEPAAEAAAEPGRGGAIVVRPHDVIESTVGRANWSRTIRMAVGPDRPGTRLVIGECVNPAGNWSGTPPHKHDVDDPPRESAHEEAYVFRFARPDGWGILRAYSTGPGSRCDETVVLRDGTAVLIRRGYHQVVAGPGHAVYYPFILAGPAKPLRAAVDPEQAWLAHEMR